MRIITGKYLSRRTVLRNLGRTALALPFLDAMHPAMAQERLTAAAPVKRLGIGYYPHGVIYEKWVPQGTGGPLTLTSSLAAFADYRDRLTVIAGLSSTPDRTKTEFHDRAMATWLTAVEPTRGKVQVGPSLDQIAARAIGGDTRLASIELATEALGDFGGPSFRDATTALPFEINPRLAFERLFGEGGRIDPAAAAAERALDRSLLDALVEQISGLKGRLGASDNRTLDQYLDSIRDLERRLQLADARPVSTLPTAVRPSGIPVDWVEHVKLMMDIIVLAYQADVTRVATLMLGAEGSGMSFPHLGITLQHHEASHHNYDPVKLDALEKVNRSQSELFAYFLAKLDGVKEPSGSLLDNALLFFGSTLSNPVMHSQRDLPVMLAGGAGGRLKGGRFIRVRGDPPPWPSAQKWPADTSSPLANLHLSLLDLLGVPTEHLGNSNGRISL